MIVEIIVIICCGCYIAWWMYAVMIKQNIFEDRITELERKKSD